MKAIELLEKYPKAAEAINEFYRSKMIESLDTEDVPEEFKELVKQQEFDSDYIAKFMDGNPRILFDVLDMNKIFVTTEVTWKNEQEQFSYSIHQSETEVIKSETTYDHRSLAEKLAIEKAIQILNDNI